MRQSWFKCDWPGEPPYSFLNPFTGFAIADRIVLKLIVANAINMAPAPANINTHKLRLV